ncbi:MAG: hypothetical protein ACRDKE_12840 [Solirubrobacterales bacterium]
MTSQVDPPATEEEARESNAKLKRLVRLSPLFYTPVFALILWIVDVPYFVPLVVAFVAFELISYPFVARALDRSTEERIAQIRAEQGLTPTEDLPDVGI